MNNNYVKLYNLSRRQSIDESMILFKGRHSIKQLLGIDIDKLLSFDDQIEKVCKKLASRIAVLRKIRVYLPLNQCLQYANFNAICPRYKRETEGGRTFLVTATRQWNNIPLNIRKADSLNCFKNNLRSNILKDQQLLHHFSI